MSTEPLREYHVNRCPHCKAWFSQTDLNQLGAHIPQGMASITFCGSCIHAIILTRSRPTDKVHPRWLLAPVSREEMLTHDEAGRRRLHEFQELEHCKRGHWG